MWCFFFLLLIMAQNAEIPFAKAISAIQRQPFHLFFSHLFFFWLFFFVCSPSCENISGIFRIFLFFFPFPPRPSLPLSSSMPLASRFCSEPNLLHRIAFENWNWIFILFAFQCDAKREWIKLNSLFDFVSKRFPPALKWLSIKIQLTSESVVPRRVRRELFHHFNLQIFSHPSFTARISDDDDDDVSNEGVGNFSSNSIALFFFLSGTSDGWGKTELRMSLLPRWSYISFSPAELEIIRDETSFRTWRDVWWEATK